jgi:hypothetical protein
MVDGRLENELMMEDKVAANGNPDCRVPEQHDSAGSVSG